ncbi:twin-arginine translocase TatA/TatE family subunit [Pseudomonas aeruginosa]|uniref:twin-arginine translocase TatA/TatE family subunit n=1 Tax=Pseudomonas aeruginosa TaxID=287 RepID=UPI000EB20DB7|nr:twin-arginine translocase TatA/TatE family subunit [Pseudomonas aeruginosa]NNB83821.1 twin-arginine translocase TatA/TatE family subunit [Pseudomonas aeruginosa]
MGIGIWKLLIILLIVVMFFGTKRLKGIGSDLGDAIKGFRKSINNSEDNKPAVSQPQGQSINGETLKLEESVKS